MKTKTLAIGLFPERLDVVLCAGSRAVAARRVALGIVPEGSRWTYRVRDLAKAVRASAQEMGAIGLPARVFYRGSDACAEFASPRATSTSEAAAAAVLACADSLPCALDLASSSVAIIAIDKDGSEPKAHCVVSADADESLTAIADMVTNAGLKFLSAAPIDAITMHQAALGAVTSPNKCSVVVHFGEYRSYLIVAAASRLVFTRPIAMGLDSLVTSLKRPMRLAGAQSIELSEEAARTIVHECGIPSRTQIVDEKLQLTGGQIIPLLQPVLQRFMIELRQSLRFGLPERPKDELTLRLVGPGARTPGLNQIISDELGVRVEVEERARSYDSSDPISPASELVEAIEARRSAEELALEPLAVSRKRRMRQLQRWLWSGAAASLALVGFDSMRLSEQLGQVRSQVESRQALSAGAAETKATMERLVAADTALSKLERTIDSEVGARVRVGAVMKEISRLTPPSIRLYSLTFKPGTGVIIGGLSGFAIADEDQVEISSRMLDSYMRELGRSPLLQKLSLANVQSTLVEDSPAQSFDISFDAVNVPNAHSSERTLADAESGQEWQP